MGNRDQSQLRTGSVDDERPSLIEELALKLAYEGQRWSDLVRVALRRNDPAFLADKVYLKLKRANNPQADAVRAKLMNKSNWFLPFKLK